MHIYWWTTTSIPELHGLSPPDKVWLEALRLAPRGRGWITWYQLFVTGLAFLAAVVLIWLPYPHVVKMLMLLAAAYPADFLFRRDTNDLPAAIAAAVSAFRAAHRGRGLVGGATEPKDVIGRSRRLARRRPSRGA